MGYNGSATITFCVERAKDSEGKFHPVQEGDDPERIEEIEVEVSGRSYFAEGRFSGPPEDCYPDEGETEVETVTFNGVAFELTDKEMRDAESMIDDAVQNAEPDYPEPDDREYDESPYDGDYEVEYDTFDY